MSIPQRQYLTSCVSRQVTSRLSIPSLSIGAPNRLTGMRLCMLMIGFILLIPKLVLSETLSDTAVVPQHAWLAQEMSLADARHLAQRTGFGATPDELLALTGLQRADAVQAMVDNLSTEPTLPMPSWVDAPAPRFWSRRSLPQEQQRQFDQQRDQEMTQLRQWWVNNLLQSDSPQTERLVLFWHDHFATSYDGVGRRSIAMAKQNRLFRTMGTGSYRDLLKAIIRDPAMLTYLDNQSSRVGKPNENLARELLELFTMGEGHYDEATVKEAARALTGYGVSETKNLSFRFYGYKHDQEEKTLFGVAGNHNGDDLIDLILKQDATAEHLVKKLWHAYVSDSQPNQQFVQTVSKAFRQSDYNLTHLYRSVLSSEAFWHTDNRLSLIKSPATLLIGAARSLDYPKRHWSQLPALHALLGMEFFSPPNVAGWQEGAAFVAPGRLLNRQLALDALMSVPNDSGQEGDSGNMMMATDTGGMTSGMKNGMKNNLMSSVGMQDGTPALSVKLAGHFYRGAPQYQVKLHAADKSVLWRSDVRALRVGYDTEKFGEMRSQSMLPWHKAEYFPNPSALAQTHSVSVEFLNDAASAAGDRNLFVESVTLNGVTYSSMGAEQQSACVPKNNRHAGRLYCAGTVDINISEGVPAMLPRNVPFSATNARTIWAREKQQRLDTIIALENVQVSGQFFHTISFHLRSNNEQSLELALDSYGCWPDCIQRWPECAWQNEIAPNNKSLVFPVGPYKRVAKSKQCHYQSISKAEQALVNGLYSGIIDIVKNAWSNEPAGNRKNVLSKWLVRLQGLENKIAEDYSIASTGHLVLDAQFEVPERKAMDLPEPPVVIDNLLEYHGLATSHGLVLPELLLGGAELQQFPELFMDGTVEQQLQRLITHPVYQVY